jgi:ribosomal-protein-alanine N-acetyltransferase
MVSRVRSYNHFDRLTCDHASVDLLPAPVLSCISNDRSRVQYRLQLDKHMKHRIEYIFAPMSEGYANDIANWHYDGVYSFYDMAADPDDLRILMDTRKWRDTIKAVLNEEQELVGWAAFYMENDEFWLSLGLRPDLTGRGLGEEFVYECVCQAKSQHKSSKDAIKLHVAVFNQRAIKVYQRVGFVETKKLVRDTPIGSLDFIEMERHVES